MCRNEKILIYLYMAGSFLKVYVLFCESCFENLKGVKNRINKQVCLSWQINKCVHVHLCLLYFLIYITIEWECATGYLSKITASLNQVNSDGKCDSISFKYKSCLQYILFPYPFFSKYFYTVCIRKLLIRYISSLHLRTL